MTMPPMDPNGTDDDEDPMPMPPTDGDLPEGDDMLELLRLHNMARCTDHSINNYRSFTSLSYGIDQQSSPTFASFLTCRRKYRTRKHHFTPHLWKRIPGSLLIATVFRVGSFLLVYSLQSTVQLSVDTTCCKSPTGFQSNYEYFFVFLFLGGAGRIINPKTFIIHAGFPYLLAGFLFF